MNIGKHRAKMYYIQSNLKSIFHHENNSRRVQMAGI